MIFHALSCRPKRGDWLISSKISLSVRNDRQKMTIRELIKTYEHDHAYRNFSLQTPLESSESQPEVQEIGNGKDMLQMAYII